MAKTTNPFDHLSDMLNEALAELRDIRSILDTKPTTLVSSQPPLLTTRQAAEFLGISPKTIYNNLERFQPVKLKQGGLRFRKVDLEKLVA